MVDALDLGHPAEPGNETRRLRDAELCPQRSSLLRRRGGATIQVEPEPDDLELRPRRDTCGDEFVADLRAHGDQRIRAPRKRALDLAECPGSEGVEVSL